MMARNSVVFPAPLSPMTATASPPRTSSDTPCRTSRPPYPAQTSRTAMIRSGAEIAAEDTLIVPDLLVGPFDELLAEVHHHDPVGVVPYQRSEEHTSELHSPLH